ncbi:MAG: glycosyltransferase [Pseudomonadota bacterium]
MTPAKILLLDTGREWGGGTNSMFELLKRIDRSRFAVTALFYHNYRKGEDSDLQRELQKIGVELRLQPQPRQPLWAKLAKELIRAMLAWNRGLRNRTLFKLELAWRIRPNARHIARVLREGGYDLLYLNNQPSSNLEGLLAAEATGIPVLQHARKVAALNPDERHLANRWLRRMICVSEGVRAAFVGQGIAADKCVVVCNGIDISAKPRLAAQEIRRRHGIAPDEIVVGTAGSLIKLKHVDQLIEAMAVLAAAKAPVKCLIVGDGPRKSKLQALAKTRGVADRCIFTGFQPDAFSYINAMDVFTLCSSQEGLPRVILEAMLLGKPVVASNVTGSSELVLPGATGFLFPFGQSAPLAAHILALVSDESLRARMGAAAKVRVAEHYSIERYVAGVEAMLEEAAS